MSKQRSWFLCSPPKILRSLSYVGVLAGFTSFWGIPFTLGVVSAAPSPSSLPLLSSAPGTLLAQNPAPPLLQFGSEGPEVQSVQALLTLLGYYSGQLDGRYQESTLIAVSAFQKAAGLSEDGIIGPTTWEKLLPSVPQVGASSDTVTPSAVSTAPSSNSSTSSEEVSQPQPEVPEANESAEAASAGTDDEGSTEAPVDPPADDIRLPTLRLGMRGPAVRNLQERLSALGLLQGTVDGVFGSQTEESVKSAQRYFNLTPDGVVGSATWRALLQ